MNASLTSAIGIYPLQKHTSRTHMILKSLILFAAILCIQVPAQVATYANPTGETVYSHVNHQAVLSRSGNSAATAELAHQLFKNVAIPTDLADAFGFTERIVHAETDYRNGAHPAVHESDVVKAVNNMVDAIGAPQWAHTSPAEVSKLRMHMLAVYPQLLASQEPPDSKGHVKAVSNNLRPMEAAYLATTLLYQKAYNSEYQFTEAEKAQNATLSPAEVKAKHKERINAIQAMLHGKTQSVSVRDLMTASDRLFSDLGVEPTTLVSTLGNRNSNNAKGGQ
jgi:hypothetical protein